MGSALEGAIRAQWQPQWHPWPVMLAQPLVVNGRALGARLAFWNLVTPCSTLNSWIDQLKWQRLRPFEKLADMLVDHLEGILTTTAPASG
jgi:hypothetical protein